MNFLQESPSERIAVLGSIHSSHQLKTSRSAIPIRIQTHRRQIERESNREFPKRDRDMVYRRFSRDPDVRYFSSLRSFREIMRPPFSCNEEQCPVIQERFVQHQLERHSSGARSSAHGRGIAGRHSIATSPSLPRRDVSRRDVSRRDVSRRDVPRRDVSKNCVSTQSDLSNANMNFNCKRNYHDRCIPNKNYDMNISRYNKRNPKSNNNRSDTAPNGISTNNDKSRKNNFIKNNSNNIHANTSDTTIPLNRSKTIAMVTPKRNIYKDYIYGEIKAWFRNVPVYSNLGEDMKDENVTDNLAENIINLLTVYNTTDYEEKVKHEVETFLEGIIMWYPGAKRDQEIYRHNLSDKLLKRIRNINERIHVTNDNIKNDGLNEMNKFSKINNELHCQNKRDNDSKTNNESLTNNEVHECLRDINNRSNNSKEMHLRRKQIADAILKKIAPLLNRPICNKKPFLKSAIIEVLSELPININRNSPIHRNSSKNGNLHLYRFAEDLEKRLLSIQKRLSDHVTENNQLDITSCGTIHELEIYESHSKESIFEDDSKNFEGNKDESMVDILLDSYKTSNPDEVTNEIVNFLMASSYIFQENSCSLAKNIQTDLNPKITKTVSVYTSEEKGRFVACPVTSTPKQKSVKKTISKLNAEETKYMEKVADLIRAWMDTLPETFSSPEERDFKDTIVNDLAGDIMDEAKLEQLAPGTREDRDKYVKYLVYKWIIKLDVIDLEEVVPQIEVLLVKIKDIPVPKMTRPQHGSRQAMANIQHMEGEKGWKEYFVPTGKHVLEDEISIWMNEQPSDIFVDSDISNRNNKIHELAQVLEKKISNKHPGNEILNDIANWLDDVLKKERKQKVIDKADILKDRVINLPQDATLAANLDKKLKQRAEYLKEKTKSCCRKNNSIANSKNVDDDPETTMKIIVGKFIEHNYDFDDSLARSAFNYLLKKHLQRLSPSTRQEVCENIAKGEKTEGFPSQEMMKELEYIKDISDWLKNIPINSSYNTVGNKKRIDFVNNLAMNIRDVEEQRETDPDAMDYNMIIASIVSQFIYELPILNECKNNNNINFMIDQLIGKIIAHRGVISNNTILDRTANSSGIHDDNIGDFLEEFIRAYGSDIADDEVKMEAWAIRLIREINKIIRDSADPETLCKAQVYNQLTNVQIPGDETVNQFNLELEYVKGISCWLKNLPLLPMSESEKEITRKICDLAEAFTERDRNKAANFNDKKIDTDFQALVAKWISELPLDKKHEIVLPVAILQLMNRIERIKNKQENPDIEFANMAYTKLTEEDNKTKKTKSKSCKKYKDRKMLADEMVDAILKWSNSLPLKAKDNNATKLMKDDISRRLFQKVGELNMDPRVFNDDLLYQDILVDEVDTIFENVPQNVELQKNKKKLKTDLIKTIIEINNDIKELSAGDCYRLKLENTIEASIPNPVESTRTYDPGFEIYKNRLAEMFILQNFDHGIDAVKIKYEKLINNEINRYFDHAKHKNALPLSKDEIFNELYSALFKVPIPNEMSVKEEVEVVKTRCEIDAWFEELPLREPGGLGELLEWDQNLSTLAKRIHEIETIESKPDQKIIKEIIKLLKKFPLSPGQENNLDQFADKLLKTLKSTAKTRKCVLENKKSKGKGKSKSKESIKKSKYHIQIPGPTSEGQIGTNVDELRSPKKNVADIILEIVEHWCHQIPIFGQEDDLKIILDNLVTKIMIKISELNMDTTIFNDSFVYDNLLEKELETLLSTVPTCCDFEESKRARFNQIKQAIKSVKPLIKEEKARHKYKQDLNRTVDKILEKPDRTDVEKEAVFTELKEQIIDEFFQYNYGIDEEGRQGHKVKVRDAIVTFIDKVVGNRDIDKRDNTLMKTNHLLCELAKIPKTSEESIKEEVEEIRMKNELTEFFDELGLPDKNTDKTKVKLIKTSLAKILNDIEMNGHSSEFESKMKHEITRCLKKIGKQPNPEIIDSFISKLRNNEIIRRAPRMPKVSNTCQEDCKRICHTEKQLHTSSYKSDKEVSTNEHAQNNMAHETGLVNRNLSSIDSMGIKSQRQENLAPRHKGSDDFSKRTDKYSQFCSDAFAQDENTMEDNYPMKKRSNDLKRLRCQYVRRARKSNRQYCMVPMRWYCEGFNDYNSFWCRMPLPGFF